MRQQDEAGGGLVRIELREKGVEHLRLAQRPVGARKVGTIAPVLKGAEEKHLDAELARLLDDREDIRLLHRPGIDPLLALNCRQRGDAVAQTRGTLELQLFGSRHHLGRQMIPDATAFPRQEVTRLARQRRIIDMRDLARAWAGAALDLVEQAGPGAVLVIGIGAGAQQKCALQGVQRAVHRPDAGEGAKIIALPVARAAMLGELRCRVVAGQQDVGKRLVVAHQHIEARLHLLDVIRLEQQRLGLGRRRHEDHGGGERDHPRDAAIVATAAGIARNARFDALGLADIEHLARIRNHAVDARTAWRMAQIGANHRSAPQHGSRCCLPVERQVERARQILLDVVIGQTIVNQIRCAQGRRLHRGGRLARRASLWFGRLFSAHSRHLGTGGAG